MPTFFHHYSAARKDRPSPDRTIGVVRLLFITTSVSLLLSSQVRAHNEELPPPTSKEMSREERTENSFAIAKAADFVVEITANGKLDIGVTSKPDPDDPTSGKRHEFDPDELIRFFDQFPRKRLLVAIFHKSMRTDEKINAEVKKLGHYFKERGFERIVIQQYYGFGRGTYLDTAVSPNPHTKKAAP